MKKKSNKKNTKSNNNKVIIFCTVAAAIIIAILVKKYHWQNKRPCYISYMNNNKKNWYPAVAKANIGAKRKSEKAKVAAKDQGENKGMSISEQLKFLGYIPK